MTEEKAKALDYVEVIIASMREASFKCKEFCIVICSALMTVYAALKQTSSLFIFLCTLVLLLFWLLDSFYLYKERILRTEYRRIASMNYEQGDTTPLLFNTRVIGKEMIKGILKALFCSVSTGMLYLPLVILSICFGIHAL